MLFDVFFWEWNSDIVMLYTPMHRNKLIETRNRTIFYDIHIITIDKKYEITAPILCAKYILKEFYFGGRRLRFFLGRGNINFMLLIYNQLYVIYLVILRVNRILWSHGGIWHLRHFPLQPAYPCCPSTSKCVILRFF